MRSKVRWLAILSLLSCMTSAVAGPGDRADPKLFRLVATEASVSNACTRLMLSPVQRSSVERLYAEYLEDVTSLETETRRRMDEAGYAEVLALRAELAPAWSPIGIRTDDPRELERLIQVSDDNLDDPRWQRVETLTRAYKKPFHAGRRQAYVRLETWLAQVRAALELSDDGFAPFARLIRREMMEPERDQAHLPDFQRRVDLLAMIAAAARDGEIATLLDLAAHAPVDAPCGDAGTRLQEIAFAYEVALDEHFRLLIVERLRPSRLSARPTSASVDDFDWRTVDDAFLRPWTRRHRIAQQGVDAVWALLAMCGEPTLADRWIDRYHHALCPTLMQPRWPDGLVDWLAARPDHTDEQLASARALHKQYTLRHRELRAQAVRAGIEVRHVQLFAAGSSPAQLNYARALLRLHEHSRSVVRQLAASLTPVQRDALSRIVHRGGHARPQLLGPPIDGASLAALGENRRLDEPIF